ncbi:AraC family transcriptional regulator [Paenibacillus radicis (ex Gao et al. 2016)]|uniref:AraC family transcriptional regulator n=1 Tax=Paenibacillus radicis (ex Gao et al. 2016) TaxID=1737354 RepID=A0A917HJN0_9BACL|nr:AraC family transcriptional regulator [Paenibacillus radicis (ex Gao et al. 2016)]GGG81499.1 hypothetical protein GCM10010918_43440 [Paenibacillus radicis (ex Gao et al. 2016)]
MTQQAAIAYCAMKEIRHEPLQGLYNDEDKEESVYTMLVITEGSGTARLAQDGIRLIRGSCLITPPGSELTIKPERKGLQGYIISFLWSGVPGKLASASRDVNLFPCTGEMTCLPFSQAIESIGAIYSHRLLHGQLELFQNQIRFQQLLLFLLQQNQQQTAETDIRRGMEQSIRYLKEHYREPFTVDLLAERTMVSRWRYTRMFKELTGQLPLDYVNGIRIERSKQLLLQTEDRLHAIAETVGYNSEYYFNRRFKQTVGISPGQYRRIHRDDLKIYAPYMEDFLLALGINPIAQCWDARWGKQEYLGLQDVPVLDPTSLSDLSACKPDFIILDGGYEKYPISIRQFERLAPTYRLQHPGENWRATLQTMADFLGKTEQADQVIAQYENKAEAASLRLRRSVSGQSVACVRLSASGIYLYGGVDLGYTGSVLYGDLDLTPHPLAIELSARASRLEMLTAEKLKELDAEHLFVVYDKYEGSIPNPNMNPIWRSLPAVQAGRVYEVDFLTWMNYGVLSHNKKIDDVLLALA